MTVNSAEILQSKDMEVWLAPYSASLTFPTDSAHGTAPGGTWRNPGSTDGGLGFNVETTFEGVTVDQSIDEVGVIATGRNIRLSAQLAQWTMQNLKDATSQGTLTTVPAASGVRGHVSLNFDNTIGVNRMAVYFDVKHALGDQEPMRFFGPYGQVRSAIAGTISAASKLVLPVDVQLFPDPNNSNRVLEVRDVIAALP